MWLILTVCLAGAAPGAACRTEALGGFDEVAGGPLACLLAGPAVAADWAGRNPKWVVVGWRCGAPERRA